MKFSINSFKTILGMDDTFRLKRNGNWEKQSHFTEFDLNQDMLFHSYESAKAWLENQRLITIDGESIDTTPKDIREQDFFQRDFEIVLHRTEKPRFPLISKSDLKKVLLDGDDTHHNSLILNYHGKLELLPLFNRSPLNLSGYAVRYETFDAGNGYVGPSSSLFHLDDTYNTLLQGWLDHLKGGLPVYCDFHSHDYSDKELIELISAQITLLSENSKRNT